MEYPAMRVDVINPRRNIKRGGVHYRYGRTCSEDWRAWQVAVYEYGDLGYTTCIIHEVMAVPQSWISKLLFGTMEAHAFHVYYAGQGGHYSGGERERVSE